MDETNQTNGPNSIDDKLKLAQDLIDYSAYMDGRKKISACSEGTDRGYSMKSQADYVRSVRDSIIRGEPEAVPMYAVGINDGLIDVISSYFLEQRQSELFSVPEEARNHLPTLFNLYIINGKALDEGMEVAQKLLDNPIFIGRGDNEQFNQGIYSAQLNVISSFLSLVKNEREDISKVQKYVPSQKVVETYNKINAKTE